MSPATSFAVAVWRQLPFFVWLIALWMLLWGQFTVLAALTGLIVAVFVTRIFRLPPVELSGRVNLWYGLAFIVTFFGALVRGSLLVAWQTLALRRYPGTAIVAVQLRTDDDLILAHVGVTASLIPGSLIVDIDRDRRILYLRECSGCRPTPASSLAPRGAAVGSADRAGRRLACATAGDPRRQRQACGCGCGASAGARQRRAPMESAGHRHLRRVRRRGAADPVAHHRRPVDPRPGGGVRRAADPRHVHARRRHE
ncbi:MAG: Na+/H+ antiporter subunit E [Microbacterium sp.]